MWKKNLGNLLLMSLLVFPASGNYRLEGFSLGSAGGGGLSNGQNSIEVNVGEIGNNLMVGNSVNLGAGLAFVRQANVPKAPQLINTGNQYNKLRLTIDVSDNPSDTLFAVAISKDNFLTTQFVKSDMTVGTSLTMADYRNIVSWGGGVGMDIIGLDVGSTYWVKVKAMQGKFTETQWGPTASALTELPQLSFDIDVAVTDMETAAPYLVELGDLYPDTVVTSNSRIWIDLETNANSGGSVFIYGQNSGLQSSGVGYTIPAVNGDLTALANGFGVQGVGATQSSGGVLTINSPYNGSNGVVGVTDLLVRPIFTVSQPIIGGRGSLVVKARSDNDTPAAGDYGEVLTVIAAANY